MGEEDYGRDKSIPRTIVRLRTTHASMSARGHGQQRWSVAFAAETEGFLDDSRCTCPRRRTSGNAKRDRNARGVKRVLEKGRRRKRGLPLHDRMDSGDGIRRHVSTTMLLIARESEIALQ